MKLQTLNPDRSVKEEFQCAVANGGQIVLDPPRALGITDKSMLVLAIDPADSAGTQESARPYLEFERDGKKLRSYPRRSFEV